MAETPYKEVHESFMQNNNGTTALDTLLIILPNFFTPLILRYIIVQFNVINYFRKISLEFILIVTPIILITTIAAEYKFTLLTMSAVIFLYFYKNQVCNIPNLWELKVQHKKNWQCVTYLRSLVFLTTIHCILAVDFQIFPRYLAKTEKFGYSLMDLGVGLFVFSNAIVPSKVSKYGLFKSLEQNAKPCLILFMLGYARAMIVRETGYHEHVTEYGLHWNFFITLAITKIVSTSILYIFKEKTAWISGIFLTIVYEAILANGLGEWILGDEERDNFISANREGIFSCMGYINLYLVSSYIGHIVFEKYEFKLEKEILNKLLISMLTSWTVSFLSNGIFGTSRCLANAGYCSFVFAIGSTLFTMFYAFELSIASTKQSDKHALMNYDVPIVFEAINKNGLLFFVIGNVTTGLINLLFHTLYLSASVSLFIIFLYMFIVIMTIITVQYSKTTK